MQSIFAFLIKQNLQINCEKMLMSAELKGYHEIHIFFGSSLVRTVPSLIHCRIYVTDFRDNSLWPSHPRPAPKMPILSKVKLGKQIISQQYFFERS